MHHEYLSDEFRATLETYLHGALTRRPSEPVSRIVFTILELVNKEVQAAVTEEKSSFFSFLRRHAGCPQ